MVTAAIGKLDQLSGVGATACLPKPSDYNGFLRLADSLAYIFLRRTQGRQSLN
jgi:hypothetical protein